MQEQRKYLIEQLNYGSAYFTEKCKTEVAQLKGNFDRVIDEFKLMLKESLLEEALKE